MPHKFAVECDCADDGFAGLGKSDAIICLRPLPRGSIQILEEVLRNMTLSARTREAAIESSPNEEEQQARVPDLRQSSSSRFNPTFG